MGGELRNCGYIGPVTDHCYVTTVLCLPSVCEDNHVCDVQIRFVISCKSKTTVNVTINL